MRPSAVALAAVVTCLPVMAQQDVNFAKHTARVADLRRAVDVASDREARARTALEWLVGLQKLLSVIPFGAADQEPFRSWLVAHEDLTVYNEPGGEWMVPTQLIWQTHDGVRGTRAAD